MDGANDPPLVEALRYTYTRPTDPVAGGEDVEEGHTWYDTDGDAAYIRTAGGAWRRLDIANHADLSGIGAADHHTRYTDAEAFAATDGVVNADTVDGQHASDLANADTVDGQHASDLTVDRLGPYPSGDSVAWKSQPFKTDGTNYSSNGNNSFVQVGSVDLDRTGRAYIRFRGNGDDTANSSPVWVEYRDGSGTTVAAYTVDNSWGMDYADVSTLAGVETYTIHLRGDSIDAECRLYDQEWYEPKDALNIA